MKYLPTLLLAIALTACAQVDPEAELAAAQERYAAGDYRTAAIHVSNVLQADPQNVEGQTLRGRLALATGDIRGGLDMLDRAERLGADPASIALSIAGAALQLSDPERALEALDAAGGELDDDALYWTLRGNALTAQERFDEASAAYARSDQIAPDNVRNLLGSAQLAFRRDAIDEAEALLDRALAAAPDDPDVLYARGAFYLDTARPERAAEELERAVSAYAGPIVTPQEAVAISRLVQVRLLLDDDEGAAEAAQRLSARMPNSAIADYAQGLVDYERGRLDEAVRRMQHAVNQEPENAAFLTLLGAIQLGLGNVGQAEQHLMNALAAAPGDPNATKVLAETRMRQNRPEEALSALRPLAEQGVDPEIGLMAAAASLRMGDAEQAVATLEQALARNPDNDSVRLELARAYLAAERRQDAVQLLEESFSGENSEPALLGELLLLAADMQSSDQAAGRARAEAMAREFAGMPQAMLAIATYYQLIGDGEAALRHARQFVADDPSSEFARILLARVQVAQEDLSGARETLRAAVTEWPQSRVPRETLGAVELQIGNAEQAGRIGRALAQDFPSSGAGYALEGEALIAQRRYGEAAEKFGQAFEREPEWPVLGRQLLALQLADRPAEIEEALAAWVRDQPEHLEGLLRYGMHLQSSGKNAEALEQYERAIGVDGRNLIALNNAAWLRYQTQERGALELARRAAELAPENPAVLDTLGWILAEEDRPEEGLDHLEKAAQLAPQALEIRYHVAQVQIRVGRTTEARATLEALLAGDASFGSRPEAEALLQTLKN